MSITTKQHNIGIEAGADFSLPFTVRDDSNIPVDLTGATVSAQLREYAEAQDYFQFTATHNGVGGRVNIAMLHEDTAQIGYTQGVYDVFIDFPDTTRLKYLEGDVAVTPAVTKPVNGDIMYLLSFDGEEYFPSSGSVRRLYLSHASSKIYRWNGTGYIGIREGGYTKEEVDAMMNEIDLTLAQKANTEDLGDLAYKDKADFGSDIANIPSTFPPSSHNHDSRYYTKTETDDYLSAKADTADLGDLAYLDSLDYSDIENTPTLGDLADHDTVDYETEVTNTPTLGDLASKDTVDWDTDIDDIPETFPPSAHNHDDRYYTETEVDTALSGKSNTGHTHTKSDITDFPTLGTMSAESASDYYTKSATDALLLEKAPVILAQASGAIASIPDGIASPVTALSVGIEPVQDLHGQANPYPAGGGKNLFDGVYKYHNTSALTPVTEGETYALSGKHVAGGEGINYCLYNGSTFTGDTALCQNGSLATSLFLTVTVPSGITHLNIYTHQTGINANGDVYDFQIESGSSATSYAPYSNICPISGHSTATVTRTGKNLWEFDASYFGDSAGNVIPVTTLESPLLAGTYAFSFTGTLGNAVALYLKDADGNNIYSTQWTGSGSKSATFTLTKTVYKIQVYSSGSYSMSNIQLELGSIVTTYEAPSIQTVTIDLNGTRYGAQVDVLTGEMTVTHEKKTFDGSTGGGISISYSSDGSVNIQDNNYQPNFNGYVTEVTCDTFKVVFSDTNWNNTAVCTRVYKDSSWNYTRFYIKGTGATTSEEAIAWVTAHPVTYIRPLATPLTVQLTPATLSLLLGQNNIWADTGDTSVTYRADTKGYIDKLFAQLQALILENS